VGGAPLGELFTKVSEADAEATLSTFTDASSEAFSATLTRELVCSDTFDRSAEVIRIPLEASFNWPSVAWT